MSAAPGLPDVAAFVPVGGGREPGGADSGRDRGVDRYAARRIGLWVFMGVVSSLFMLFSIAYVMRMAMTDWLPLRYIPWQLWLSTALLALASGAWELARRRALAGRGAIGEGAARQAALLACLLSLLFLGAQLWAWQAMTAMNYRVSGNPANSFFYLLSGLHGLHVIGGLVAAALAGVALSRGGATAGGALTSTLVLCARYWHFLLLLWLALFALLFVVTPELVQVVCESVGITPPQAR
jgi:cytochrome c oxidase subunit 3